MRGLIGFWLLVTGFLGFAQALQVVPKPQSVVVEGEPIPVAGNLYVVATPALKGEADLIRTWWNASKTGAKGSSVTAELRIQNDVPAEAYALRVSEGKIVVAGGSAAASRVPTDKTAAPTESNARATPRLGERGRGLMNGWALVMG